MAAAPEEVVEASEEAVAEVETAVHQSLDLEEGTPQLTSLTVGKVAAVSPQGIGGRVSFAASRPKWDGVYECECDRLGFSHAQGTYSEACQPSNVMLVCFAKAACGLCKGDGHLVLAPRIPL